MGHVFTFMFRTVKTKFIYFYNNYIFALHDYIHMHIIYQNCVSVALTGYTGCNLMNTNMMEICNARNYALIIRIKIF